MQKKAIVIIPARFASTRFPGKPLAKINGKSMVQRVYEQCKKCTQLDEVFVATEDERIVKAVEEFGGKALMTSSSHTTGTERIAEAAKGLEADVVVNVQGDEPLINPKAIEQVISPFKDSSIEMASLMKKLDNEKDLSNPNIVTVVVDKENFALYFSRSQIPFKREGNPTFFKHLGIYAFTKKFLLKFASLQPTMLEKTECLEQLRALENGHRIKMVETEFDSVAVDVPEDIAKVEKKMRELE